MYKINNSVSRIYFYFSLFLILVVPSFAVAETIMLDMVPPVSGVAHISSPGVLTPDAIMNVGLSADQNLANLLDNNPNTFYQPTAGSNVPTIGSDVLLVFEFPNIPKNAVINSVVLSVGISSENTDAPFDMGFGFASYNRSDPTRYLDVEIEPPRYKRSFFDLGDDSSV